MKLLRYTPLVLILSLLSCGSKPEAETAKTTPKTEVEVVHITNGAIKNELSLLGNTAYLKRNSVTAPIPSFITKVTIKLGDKVYKGQVMYVLQSKESRALGSSLNQIDSSLSSIGIIQVKASATGIITTFDQQQEGAYVLEGTPLCTIAESSDLVFQINVPYEYAKYTKVGNKCTVILPNKEQYTATFIRGLTSMNAANQTQTFLAKVSKNLALPENMIVKVIIQKSTAAQKQVLPKSCVLSDEMMKEFWVMKLLNDSTAIKTPISIGNKNNTEIEILSPQFKESDRIINKGNYGLTDTAFVSLKTAGNDE